MVKIYVEQAVPQKVIVSVECDKCHKVYHRGEEKTIDGVPYWNCRDSFETDEFHHIDFVGGTGSDFGDGSRVECDLCQYCLKEFIGDFCRVTHPY